MGPGFESRRAHQTDESPRSLDPHGQPRTRRPMAQNPEQIPPREGDASRRGTPRPAPQMQKHRAAHPRNRRMAVMVDHAHKVIHRVGAAHEFGGEAIRAPQGVISRVLRIVRPAHPWTNGLGAAAWGRQTVGTKINLLQPPDSRRSRAVAFAFVGGGLESAAPDGAGEASSAKSRDPAPIHDQILKPERAFAQEALSSKTRAGLIAATA